MTAGEGTPKRARFSLTFGRAMSALADVTNASPRRRRSAKCLFGAPDRDETARLVSEQYARDRKRYIRRFNFDIDTESKFEGELSPSVSPGTPRRRTPRTPRTPLRSPRTPRTPRSPKTPTTKRQLHMTDYWSIRKCSETSPSDKEN